MSTETPSTDTPLSRELRRELRRQVKIAGGIREVAGRLKIHENTLRGWCTVPGRLRVDQLDRGLDACGRPAWAVVEVIGRAAMAAGRPVASVRWGGGLFFGPEPDPEEGGRECP